MAFSAVRSAVNSPAASCASLAASVPAHEQLVAAPKAAFLSGSSSGSGVSFLQGKKIVSQSSSQRTVRQGRRSGSIKAVAAGPKKTEEGNVSATRRFNLPDINRSSDG